MTKNLIAIALLATAAVALTACGKGEEKAGAEHEAATEHTPAHSSAGLPSGNAEAGEKLEGGFELKEISETSAVLKDSATGAEHTLEVSAE